MGFWSILPSCIVIAISIFAVISIACYRAFIRKNEYESSTRFNLFYASVILLGVSVLYTVIRLIARGHKPVIFWISLVVLCIAVTVYVMDYIHERQKNNGKKEL